MCYIHCQPHRLTSRVSTAHPSISFRQSASRKHGYSCRGRKHKRERSSPLSIASVAHTASVVKLESTAEGKSSTQALRFGGDRQPPGNAVAKQSSPPAVGPGLQKMPEVLAPAGGWPQLRAAVENGADAVYFGLSSFNARARAANFLPEELEEVSHMSHSPCQAQATDKKGQNVCCCKRPACEV